MLERPAPDHTATIPHEREVQVTAFPREAYTPTVDLSRYVVEHSHAVPHRRLGRSAWSLEQSAIDALLEKIQHAGVPLAEVAGVKPYRGVLTGLNEAFLIDTPTRDRLVKEDPACADIIKPYLRGQDIKRWAPDWHDLWMIVLAASENREWPWSVVTDADAAEGIFARAYPSIHGHFLPLADALKKRQDKGRYWWELRSCSYYAAFAQPKILYQDITWRSQFTFDPQNRMCNNTVYVLTSDSPWLLTVLNSPLLWSFLWRRAAHGKDEALRLFSQFVEAIPIAPCSDAALGAVESAVERLTTLTRMDQQARQDLLLWLHTEFDIASPGQRLEEFDDLNEDEFVAEVRKRRPAKAGKLTPAALRALLGGYKEIAVPFRERHLEAVSLERRLSDLVNAAYGLTAEEVALLWETAPPRMPRLAHPDPTPVSTSSAQE